MKNKVWEKRRARWAAWKRAQLAAQPQTGLYDLTNLSRAQHPVFAIEDGGKFGRRSLANVTQLE